MTRKRHRSTRDEYNRNSSTKGAAKQQIEHYVYRGSGPPAKDAVYVLDGVTHRWDGKCHEDCENLR